MYGWWLTVKVNTVPCPETGRATNVAPQSRHWPVAGCTQREQSAQCSISSCDVDSAGTGNTVRSIGSVCVRHVVL